MKNIGTVNSVSEYIELIEGVHDRDTHESRFFCRGQSSCELRLRPKIGRYQYSGHIPETDPPVWRIKADEMFEQFERDYVTYHPAHLERKIDRLTLAQHYGLATQLLDWTLNPLVALYFACELESKNNGIVFLFSPWPVWPAIRTDADMNIDRVLTLRPRLFDQRMINQESVFTFHPDPIADFGDELGDDIFGVKIPASSKAEIMNQLKSIGIHISYIYPGLTSVCNRITEGHKEHRSFTEDKKYWANFPGLIFEEHLDDSRPSYIQPKDS